MKKLLFPTLASWLVLAGMAQASDLLTFQAISGTHTNTYTDSGSGLITISFGTTINGWEFLSGSVYSQPYVGDASDDYTVLNLGSIENISSSSPLTLTVTETSFSPFSTTLGTFDMSLSDYAGVNSSLTGFINNTSINTLNTTSGNAAISSQNINNSGLTSSFSMTETVVLPASPEASGPVFAELYLFPVPEPTTISLVAAGLLGLLALRRSKA